MSKLITKSKVEKIKLNHCPQCSKKIYVEFGFCSEICSKNYFEKKNANLKKD